MGSTDATKSCLRQYATFSGRARRSEYWYFHFFQMLVWLAVTVVAAALLALAGAVGGDSGDAVGTTLLILTVLLCAVAYLGLLLPSLAVSWRRLHDTGRSGWWMLLAPVPGAGIVPSVFLLLDSAPGTNPSRTSGRTPTSEQFPPGPATHHRNS